MGHTLVRDNIRFKVVDKEGDEYTCNFVAKLSEDFMQNNIPDDLVPGNELVLHNVNDDELWVVVVTAVVYDDGGGDRYGLSIYGSCTFQLFSKSARCETYESGIGLI